MSWMLRVGAIKSGDKVPVKDWDTNGTLEECLEEMLYNTTHGNIWRQELIWERNREPRTD